MTITVLQMKSQEDNTMKKDFSSAAEELITGIPSAPDINELSEENKKPSAKGGYLRYVEPRSERMNLLLSKSLVKKLEAEAKKRRISKNGLVNEILEKYFSE